jgi:hypothetical protein
MASNHELQAQQYWRLMKGGVDERTAADFRDEMQVLGIMTDSEKLRVLCARNERRYDGHISIPLMALGIK